jgi:hypothetical protein
MPEVLCGESAKDGEAKNTEPKGMLNMLLIRKSENYGNSRLSTI